jgi:hypothetical protein
VRRNISHPGCRIIAIDNSPRWWSAAVAILTPIKRRRRSR